MAGRYKPYPEYKESGVEVLGRIPKTWTPTPVKRIGNLKGGAGFPHDDQGSQGEELDFHKVNALGKSLCDDFLEKSENTISKVVARKLGAFIFPEKSIVFAKVGAALLLARIRWLNAPACIDNNMMGFVVSAGNDAKFVKYSMNTMSFDYIVNPGAVPSLNESKIGGMVLAMPSTIEQVQIANFLDHETGKIDTLIEKQQQLIQLLKEKRQAVISHAVTKGLSSLNGGPNVKMRDSGVEWLGEVPEHWEVWKLCHFAPIITCGVAVTPEYVDDGVIFLSAQNVKKWRIDLSRGHKYISQKSHAELTKNRMPANGDILLSRVGTIGEACIVDVDFEFSIFVSLTHLRLNSAICTNEFFIYLCESQYVRSMHGAVTLVGGGVGNLNVNDLRIYKLVIPSLNEQQEIVKFISGQVSRVDRLIDEAEKAVALIQERRTALISAAVTGKIDVRDWVAPQASTTHKEVAA